jgi:branched-subunit amino acid ABC-type transport system permease component
LGATYAVIGAAVAVVAVATRTLHLAVGQVLVAGVLVALVLGSPVTGLPAAVVLAVAILAGAVLSAALGPLVLDRLPDGLPWLLGLVVVAGTVDAALARGVTAATYRPAPLLPLPGGRRDRAGGRDRDRGRHGPRRRARRAAPPLAVGPAGPARRRLVDGRRPGGVEPRVVRAQALALGGGAAVVAGLLAAPIAFVGTGQATASPSAGWPPPRSSAVAVRPGPCSAARCSGSRRCSAPPGGPPRAVRSPSR